MHKRAKEYFLVDIVRTLDDCFAKFGASKRTFRDMVYGLNAIFCGYSSKIFNEETEEKVYWKLRELMEIIK